MSQQNEISVRARAAAEAFRHGCTPEAFMASWRDSASIYFDEFVKTVKDDRHPIPSAYFESGFCISSNPIFAMLEPKGVLCAFEGHVSRGTPAISVLGKSENEIQGHFTM